MKKMGAIKIGNFNKRRGDQTRWYAVIDDEVMRRHQTTDCETPIHKPMDTLPDITSTEYNTDKLYSVRSGSQPKADHTPTNFSRAEEIDRQLLQEPEGCSTEDWMTSIREAQKQNDDRFWKREPTSQKDVPSAMDCNTETGLPSVGLRPPEKKERVGIILNTTDQRLVRDTIHSLDPDSTEIVATTNAKPSSQRWSGEAVKKWVTYLGFDYKEVLPRHYQYTNRCVRPAYEHGRPYHAGNYFERDRIFADYVDRVVVISDGNLDDKTLNVLREMEKHDKPADQVFAKTLFG